MRLIKKQLRLLRNRHLYVTAQAKDGTAVTVFGNYCLHHHFANLYLGKKTNWKLHQGLRGSDCSNHLRRFARRDGLAVSPLDPKHPEIAAGALIVPRFLCLSIDLPPDPSELFQQLGSSAKDDLRRVRKNKFHFGVSRDPGLVDEFHHCMYKPGVLSRHGVESTISSRSDLHKEIKKDNMEFLQIFLGNSWVAAALSQNDQDCYRMFYLGWRQGSNELYRQGALTAIYKASVERAYALGKRSLVLGGTLPYLEDGVMAYKAKWGAAINGAKTTYRNLAWHIHPEHPHLQRFFRTRSIVARGRANRFVVYSGKPPETQKSYGPMMASVSAWYRLLEAPDPSFCDSGSEVPVDLQPWFKPEPLPRK